MPERSRHGLPDNLDPLVDTLSNVVGILVIVVVLTQIQLGDALERVAELDLLRIRAERARASVPAQADALEARRDAVLRRTDTEIDEAVAVARETLRALEAIPRAGDDAGASRSLEEVEEDLARAERDLEALRAEGELRERYAERLERVPKQMVARLPDPKIVKGRENWILVRYGRVYLADRETLLELGSDAIGRVVVTPSGSQIPRQAFEAAALYLRKADIGVGNFRWALRTDPRVQAELKWRTRDGGLDPGDLASSPRFRAWLDARSPELDAIVFHVWADSFEAYLEARAAVESAGFPAGWYAHENDDEFVLSLRFGPAEPPIGPVEVD